MSIKVELKKTSARLRTLYDRMQLPTFSIRSEDDNEEFARARSYVRAKVDQNPAFTYFLLLTVTMILLVIGILMVISAKSAVDALAGQNPITRSVRPLVLVILGVLGMLISVKFGYRRLVIFGPVLYLGSLFLQSLVVTPLGVSIGGNRNWVALPGLPAFQPSEFVKLGLALCLAYVIGKRGADPRNWRHLVGVIGVPCLAALAAVLAGHDMGTMLVFGAIIVTVLVMTGLPLNWLFYGGIAGSLAAGLLVAVSPSRLERISAFIGGLAKIGSSKAELTSDRDYQSFLAKLGLGSGGLTGLGPGASRQKWNYLPEADSDFIFAIVGEEFGLIGTLLILVLFCLLGYAVLRLITRSNDRIVQVLAAGIGGWILSQAMINVAVVIGLAPVIGVPLPLVSAGGSSLLATLAALGVLLSCARGEPGAEKIISARSVSMRRVVGIVRGGKTHA